MELKIAPGNIDAIHKLRFHERRAHEYECELHAVQAALREERCMAERRAHEYECELHALQAALREERRVADLRAQEHETRTRELVAQHEAAIRSYTQSRSWRLTAPLRRLGRLLRGLRSGSPIFDSDSTE